MKKLNQVKMVAILVMGTLVPVSLNAAPGMGLEGIVAPATAEFGRSAAVSNDAVEAFKAQFRETEKQITDSKEEQKKRDELGDLVDEGDRIQQTDDLFTSYKNSLADAAKKTNDKMKSLFKQFGNSAGEGVSAQDVDTSGVNAACTENVDLAQFKSLDDQMRSAPVEFLRKEGGKVVAENDKAEKAESLKKVKDLFTKWEKNNEERDAEEVEPQMGDELAHLDLDKPEGLTTEKRLERLDADIAKQKEGNKKSGKGMIKGLKEMVLGMAEKEEKDISGITGPFVKNLNEYRKALADSAAANVKKAYENCEKVAKTVGRDQPLGPTSMLNQAYQTVLAYYGFDQNSYASTFFQSLTAEARVMQCSKAASKVEEQLGAKMQAKIAALENVTEPVPFLQGALATMTELSKASKEVGKSFKKPLKQCDKIAQFKDKLEGFVGNVQQHMNQAQGQQGQGQVAGSRRPNPNQLSGAPAHNPQQPRI